MVTASLELREEGVKEESTMASASEIKLAKERLALAKAHEESASKRLSKAKEGMKQAAKMLETLSADVDDAQEQFVLSQSEVERTTACLKAAEDTREVINIDSDSDDEDGSIKKKIKLEVKEEDTDTDTEDKVVKKEVKDEDTDTGDDDNNNSSNEDESDKKPKAKRKARKKLKKDSRESSGASAGAKRAIDPLFLKQRDLFRAQAEKKLKGNERFNKHIREIAHGFKAHESSGSGRARGQHATKRIVNEMMAQDSVDDSLTREVLRQTLKLPSRSNYGM